MKNPLISKREIRGFLGSGESAVILRRKKVPVQFPALALLLQAAEVGAHLVGQAGEAVEELGVVPEHLVVLGFLVDDVVVHLAPALLEEGAALDLDIVAPVFDDVVQGAVDAVGDDLQLPSVVDAGVAGTLVGPGPFRQIVVARVGIIELTRCPPVVKQVGFG